MRPSSPLLDSVRDQFEGQDQMAKDFAAAFVNSLAEQNQLFDITFHVGQVVNCYEEPGSKISCIVVLCSLPGKPTAGS